MKQLPRLRSLAGLGVLLIVGTGGLSAGCGDDSAVGGSTSSSTATTTTTTTNGPTSGSTTSTGTGTGGEGGQPDDTTPIDVPDNTWTFVPFPNAVCMNGTPTGIGINKISTSDDVVIFLQGGNACFNNISCALTANPNGYGQAQFDDEKTGLETEPLFQRDADSILKNYNFVYVPYCTGDVHAGDNDTMLAGKMRTFHGYNNIGRYLKRILPTFPDAQHVILTGVSAGGFGAAYNYDRVAQAFGPTVDVKLIDDSGPPMSATYVPACLQKLFVDTWGIENTVPAGCTDCKPADGAFMEPFIRYTATTYSDRWLALVSSTEDDTISRFWGFGHDDCANTESLGAYPGSEYTAGLEDLRDNIVNGADHFKVYLIDGTDGQDKTHHVWLSPNPGAVSSHGVALLDWIQQELDEDPTWANVP